MKTTVLSMLAASAVTAVIAGGAVAQTNGTFLLVSTNTVSSATPTTTVEIWATWVSPDHLFVGGNYDLTAGDGDFSNPVNVLQPFNGLGTSTGVIVGNVISGASNGQLHIPGPGVFVWGNTDNPLLLATYDWTTTDFTPRSVSLDTSNTTHFMVAWIYSGATSELFPHEFTPGLGGITVVPAPGAWCVLALPFVIARRRRT